MSGGQNRNVNKRKEYNMTLSEESGIGYRKMHLTPVFFARILHSTSYFFIILFPTAFCDRSRMTGRYLIPFCIKSFYRSAHTYPFQRLRRHLSQGKASHSLLQRRSAPRKVVRLLPDKRGQLKDLHFFLYFLTNGDSLRLVFFSFATPPI